MPAKCNRANFFRSWHVSLHEIKLLLDFNCFVLGQFSRVVEDWAARFLVVIRAIAIRTSAGDERLTVFDRLEESLVINSVTQQVFVSVKLHFLKSRDPS